MRTIRKKIQKRSENFRLRFVGGVAFWNFCSYTVPCSRKRKISNFFQFFFSKIKKLSAHMAQGEPQWTFERNPWNNRDNRCHRRTTDECRFHELCWHSQAELKIIYTVLTVCRNYMCFPFSLCNSFFFYLGSRNMYNLKNRVLPLYT